MGETPPGGSFVWRTWTYRDELGDAVADMEVTARNLASMGLATNCAASLYDSGSVAWNGFLTQRRFDIRGNVAAIWNPEGRGTFFVRDGVGRVVRTYGAAYPSARLLDTAGRLVGLGTTRTGTAWDSTFWDYDPATGLCTNKTYADGSLVAHTFAADGLPLRTTFASGRWTQNAYDASRRVSSVSTSDGEGAVSYLYDAFGRVTRATGGAARYDYARDALGRVTSEVRRTGGIRPTVVSSLSRPYDAFGRPAGYGLTFYGDFRQGVCYTWGMDGKLVGMVCSNAQGRAVEVSFDWDRGRGVGWSVEGLGDCYAYFLQVFERDAWRPWLVPYAAAGKPGPRGTMPDYSVSYAFDRLGRPVSRSGDAFGYNARGEVTNATISSAAYRYAYDGIGNRQSANEDGTTTAYSANGVNQYTAVGSAQPSYDADGNLVDDGTRTFAWSASGHLTDAATSSRRLWADYDHLGRRTFRATDRRSGFSWLLSDEREFVYDGWNLIHERRYDYQDDSDTDIEYFWGPDLSGSLQGAGGVSGLVAVSIDGYYYFPGYDNNGNVIGYWDEDGSIVAEYAYDAFGNTIFEDGDMADVFPHRFSTKYYDAETDLYYYGYRYYSPSLGRWISRDPIEEEGGFNLLLFLSNNPVVFVDILGNRQGDWPESRKKDGWAFVGNMNFPGPGWSGKFRKRPTTLFDLTAKIHDLHYALNKLKFGPIANTVGHAFPHTSHGQWRGKSAKLSRKAKSDYIFKMMNKQNWEGGRWSGTLNFLSRRVFYDDPKYFCKGDDFANFLRQPESWQLDDPDYLLMIPYSHLANPPTKSVLLHSTSTSHSPGGPLLHQETVPDYYATAPEDRNPGFMMWARQALGGIFLKIWEITDQTDSSFVW